MSHERLTALVMFVAFAGVVGLAALLRLWRLGTRAFHADEGVASLIARQFANGGGYEHLPMMHGPLHYIATAGVFRILGDGDVTARLGPAIAGVLLAALPFAFVRQIGRVGAVAAALALAVSPTMLYYSRFAGADMYLALFTLALAIVLWRYLTTPERGYLYLMSLVMALLVVTTEMALVIVPIFVAYLAYRVAVDLFDQMSAVRNDDATSGRSHYETLGIDADATDKQVRKAYRSLSDGAETRDVRESLAHAYGVLTQPTRRAAYDRRLARYAVNAAPEQIVATPGYGARAALLMLAWPVAATWPFVGGLRERFNFKTLPVAAHPMLLLSLLVMPFYGPLVQRLGFIGDRGFAGQQQIYVLGGTSTPPGGELPVMMITLGALFAVAGAIGLAWRFHVWVICWALFYGTALTLFTGFFTNKGGVWTGLWGTLDYWQRTEAEVTSRPPYYYGMILPVYEFLPLIAIALGSAYLVARGTMRDRLTMLVAVAAVGAIVALPASTPYAGAYRIEMALVVAGLAVLALRLPEITKFLAFWSVAAFFAFTMVEMKEPWLAMHIVLAMSLLAAKLLDDLVGAVPFARVTTITAPSPRAFVRARGMQALAGASFAGIAVFSLHTGLLASWGHGDVPQLRNALALRDNGETPIELLQPSRTSPDVVAIRDAIERAGATPSYAPAPPIVLDTSYGFATAWLWYLRDYPSLTLRDMRRPFDAPDGAIVLADTRNRARIGGVERSVSLTYTQAWSFPDDRYEGRSTSEIASSFVSADAWASWSRYVVDRTTIGALPAQDGVAFFPRSYEAALPDARQSDVLSIAVTPEAAP